MVVVVSGDVNWGVSVSGGSCGREFVCARVPQLDCRRGSTEWTKGLVAEMSGDLFVIQRVGENNLAESASGRQCV